MSDFQGAAIAAFGTNGTGKTTTCLRYLLYLYKKGVIRAILILVPDRDEEIMDQYKEISLEEIPGLKSGIAVHVVEDNERTFEVLYKHIPPNVGLLVDDGGVIMDPRTRDSYVGKFWKRRRQKKAWVLVNCHGAMDYPLGLFKNTTEFWIFLTTDSTAHISSRIRHRKHFESAVEHVRKHVTRTGNMNYFIRYPVAFPPEIPEGAEKQQ